jgi:hypothetical protein
MRMTFGGSVTDYDVHHVGLTFEFLGGCRHGSSGRLDHQPVLGRFMVFRMMLDHVPLFLMQEARRTQCPTLPWKGRVASCRAHQREAASGVG